jgi:hypothetical protein
MILGWGQGGERHNIGFDCSRVSISSQHARGRSAAHKGTNGKLECRRTVDLSAALVHNEAGCWLCRKCPGQVWDSGLPNVTVGKMSSCHCDERSEEAPPRPPRVLAVEYSRWQFPPQTTLGAASLRSQRHCQDSPTTSPTCWRQFRRRSCATNLKVFPSTQRTTKGK